MDTERSRIEDAARRQAGLRMLQLPDELKYSPWERMQGGLMAMGMVVLVIALPILWGYSILGVLEMLRDLLNGLLK